MKRFFPYILALTVCSVPLKTQAEEEEVIFNPDPQITLEIHEESSSAVYVYGALAVAVGYALVTLTIPSVRALNWRLIQGIRQAAH